ncbi:MAG: trypsin-like peptidase domain-containing protein [Nitrosarchaeum sp.]|nr:trypsin-like peptidase domain-containing protein [Nitrosarchaeum sp.]
MRLNSSILKKMQLKPISSIEEWMFSTVRIMTENQAGEKFSATGFIFGYPVDEKKSIPFVVTNKHVIKDMKIGTLHFINEKDGNPDLGEGCNIPITDFENQWHVNSNKDVDIAVFSLGRIIKHVEKENKHIFYKMVSGRIIPKTDDLEDCDAVEDVLFIGYPKGVYDEKNYTPIIRKGITATPVYLDYNGKKQFLIDASIFPGSSGSPVFLHDNNIHWTKKDGKPSDSRTLFLGIVSEAYLYEEENEVKRITIPAQEILKSSHKQMLGLGIVFKSETIITTIEEYLKKNQLLDKTI